jgi:hypothetical protein
LAPRVDEILEEARRSEELGARAEMLERLKVYGPLAPLMEIVRLA